MKVIEIELFKSLTEINYENQIIDFHNNYHCNKIKYDLEDNSLTLSFISENKKSNANVIFEDAEILEFDFSFDLNDDFLILDNMYRGRYTYEDHLIDSLLSKGFIYIDFIDNKSFIIKCLQLRIEISHLL